MKYAQLQLLDPTSSDASELCAELNRLLPVKLLINAILTSTALALGYWKVFFINSIVLVRGIIEIAEANEDTLGFYDPGELADETKLNDLKKVCLWQLYFFFAFLYGYVYKSVSINYDVFFSC